VTTAVYESCHSSPPPEVVVVLYVQVSDITIDPLFNIPSEFEDMRCVRTKNIIESM
jgi:hypothetical protein